MTPRAAYEAAYSLGLSFDKPEGREDALRKSAAIAGILAMADAMAGEECRLAAQDGIRDASSLLRKPL